MPYEAVCGLEQPAKQQQLPSFPVWQARQLWSRDLLFGCVLALILLLYYSKTVPRLCMEGSLSCPLLQQQQHGKQQQLLWMIICGSSSPQLYAAPMHGSSSSSNRFQHNLTAGSGLQSSAVGLGLGAGGGGRQYPAMQQGARLAAAAAAKLTRPVVALVQVKLAFSV
jgi:hypothetical protein